MPRIGFEWQFKATDLTFQERSGGPWRLITDIPSKGLIFHWVNPDSKFAPEAEADIKRATALRKASSLRSTALDQSGLAQVYFLQRDI